VAAAAAGQPEALARALDAAVLGGCPPVALREAVLMLAPFGGFPRTLDALAALHAAFERGGVEAPQPMEDEERETHARRGRDLFDRVYGEDAQRVLERLLVLDPELPHWVLQDAYGRILARPGLSAAQRERLAVVLLCALRLRNQLSGHVRGALRCGASASQIEASLHAAGALLPVDCVDAVRATLSRARAGG
jgi:4-carboxymuconolactone decarboxylase